MSTENLPSVTTQNWNAEMIATLKQTVAQGATDAEFAMFREICNASGLNPFKREVWFIKSGGRAQIMTGIHGFFAIANKNPSYDGMEIDVEMNAHGAVVKAVAKVYRKDRKFPSTGIALMSEYGKDTGVWRSFPSHMLMKCAKAIALREAFPQEINGLYTEEEMPAEYAASNANQVIDVPPARGNFALEPQQAREEPEPIFYDFTLAEADKQSKLDEWLNSGQQLLRWDINRAAWKAPRSIAKFAEYEIPPTPKLEITPEVIEALARDDAEMEQAQQIINELKARMKQNGID